MGCDFSIYEKTHDFNDDWDVYRRIDFAIKPKRNEISFNIGSKKTLFSKNPIPVTVAKVVQDRKVRRLRENENGDFIVLANREIKEELGINKTAPQRLDYKKLYNELSNFYVDKLLQLNDEKISIQPGGLKNVEPFDINKVNILKI